MAQAAHALSRSHDDCNDPGQEHFDATLLAAGKAVVRLVNSSPRTPSAKQISDLIRDTMREGFESDEAVALDQKIGRSDDPNDPLNFKPITEIDFKATNTEFAEANLPWVRLAVNFLQKDRAGVVESLRKMIADDNEQYADTLEEAWEDVEGRFEALAVVLQTARGRLEIARRHIAEGRP